MNKTRRKMETLRANLATRMECVDGIAREGDAEPVVSEEKQRFVSFLTKTIEEKEEDLDLRVQL